RFPFGLVESAGLNDLNAWFGESTADPTFTCPVGFIDVDSWLAGIVPGEAIADEGAGEPVELDLCDNAIADWMHSTGRGILWWLSLSVIAWSLVRRVMT